MTENSANDSTVVVVDDDASVRQALTELFESVGLKVVSFQSGAGFLESTTPDTSCCLVLDVRMPEMSGLKLQEELAKAEVQIFRSCSSAATPTSPWPCGR
jgi:FixJ family two-component response regulator